MPKDLADFSLTSEEEEHFIAAKETANLIKDLASRGIPPSTILEGALSQMLTQLFVGTSSNSEALDILSNCLSQASENTEKYENLINSLISSDEIH